MIVLSLRSERVVADTAAHDEAPCESHRTLRKSTTLFRSQAVRESEACYPRPLFTGGPNSLANSLFRVGS